MLNGNYNALNNMRLIDLLNQPAWVLFPFLATKPPRLRACIIKLLAKVTL